MRDHPARERCSWGHCAVVGGLLALISLIPLARLGAVVDAARRPPVPFDPSFNAAGSPPGVLTPMFGAESAAAAIGVAIQDDGSIVVLADRSPGMLPFVRR